MFKTVEIWWTCTYFDYILGTIATVAKLESESSTLVYHTEKYNLTVVILDTSALPQKLTFWYIFAALVNIMLSTWHGTLNAVLNVVWSLILTVC